MKSVALSPKYQVVIPKEARKILGITKSTKRLYVKSVSKDELVLASTSNTKKWLVDLLGSTPPVKTRAVARVRRLRDEWDD